jgi:hypothetical protein
MPLLTRKPSDDIRDRAREAGDEIADRARRMGHTVAERIDEAELREQARAASDKARERADEAAGTVRSLLSRLASLLAMLVRLGFRIAAVGPGMASKALDVFAQVLHRLGDQSEALARGETPRNATRRRNRRRAALWFAGGFTAGTATGYAVAEVLRSRSVDAIGEAPPTLSTAPRPATGGTTDGSGSAAG